MSKTVLLYKKLHPDLPQFAPARPGDAGIDLYNAGPPVVVPKHQSVSVPTGVAVKITDGYVGILTSRSSTFQKHGLFVVQGIIDSGYTGPLYTIVWHPCLNGVQEDIVIDPWQRLAQLVVVPFFPYAVTAFREGSHNPRIECVDELPKTERGHNGFGSTGV